MKGVIFFTASILVLVCTTTSCKNTGQSVPPIDSIAVYKAIRTNPAMLDAIEGYTFEPDTSVTGQGGSPISPGEADSMITNFNEEHTWFPLRVRNEAGRGFKKLRGYFIGRQVFDDLLKQGNGNNGIRVYFAKKADVNRRVFTLVFVGTHQVADTSKFKDSKSNDDNPATGYYEEIDPCPSNCGSTLREKYRNSKD